MDVGEERQEGLEEKDGWVEDGDDKKAAAAREKRLGPGGMKWSQGEMEGRLCSNQTQTGSRVHQEA